MNKKIIHSGFKKSPNSDKSEKKRVKKPRKITEKHLYNAGLAYLNRFSSSSENLKRILNRKIQRSKNFYGEMPEECDEWIEKAVVKFKSAGLLNDDLYAISSVTTMRRRGLSQKAIFAKLQQKGLTTDQIKQALETVDTEILELQEDQQYTPEKLAAFRLAKRRKIGPYRAVKNDELFQKELAILGRAGFSYDIARSILECAAEDIPD